MIKVIIIDGNLKSRRCLYKKLDFFEGYEIVGEASSANKGIDLISKMEPDLVFLDVEMSEKNGFQMLLKLILK